MFKKRNYEITCVYTKISFRFKNLSKTAEAISFPKTFKELDESAKKTFYFAYDNNPEYPGYKDKQYINRRKIISQTCISNFKENNIPLIIYTEDENNLWKFLFMKLDEIHKKCACEEYLFFKNKLVKDKVLTTDIITQIKTLNDYLNSVNNWYYRPVDGMLTERQFLNALAFRVFYSTLYIRHTSQPYYSPQPDIIHEYIGHAPQFTDKEICNLSQEIGMLSLGASNQDIKKLSAIYWYTLEFGLCWERRNRKIYGSGILGCHSELEWCLSQGPEIKNFDLTKISEESNYPLMDLQKKYYIAKSYINWKNELMDYLKIFKKNVKKVSDGTLHEIHYV